MTGRGDRMLCGTDRTYIVGGAALEDDLTDHMDFSLAACRTPVLVPLRAAADQRLP
jgi:hypothetical protein